MEHNFKKICLDDIQPEIQGFEIYKGGATNLSGPFSAEKLGFNITVVLPGAFLCPYHFHTDEEELIVILEGEATIRQDDKTYFVKKNDLIFYNLNVPHQLYNHGTEDCRLLAISNQAPEDICEYPDSKKINIRRLKKIFQAGSEVGYFKDEEKPAEYWCGKIP